MISKTLLLLGLTAAIPMTGSDSQQTSSPSTSNSDLDARIQEAFGTQANYEKRQAQNNQTAKYPGKDNSVRTRDSFPRDDDVQNIDAFTDKNPFIRDIFGTQVEYKARKSQSNRDTVNPKGDDKNQYYENGLDEVPEISYRM